MTTVQSLVEMYEAMRARFGHQGWWPVAEGSRAGERALEICIGAILTQNTNWKNVEKAIANLKANGCIRVAALHAKSHRELAELIRPAGYFNVKARRLKNFIAHVHEFRDGNIEAFLDRSVETLREELLSINGVGRETADSIILYAAGKPSFVVDAYTHRILVRHGLVAPQDDYETIKDLFESALPQDTALWSDFHAQLVSTGKNFCKPTARCAGCPLEPLNHDPDAGRESY